MPANWKICGAWQTESPSSPNENLVIPLPHSNRYFICGSAMQLSPIKKTDETAWQLADIRAGIAYITPATSEQFTPHMIGIVKLGGVSFKKGCYLGQEIVARTEHLGKAKRHLYHGTVATKQLPQAGNPVHDDHGKDVGMIFSAAFAAEASCEFLCVLEDNATIQAKLFWQQHPLNLILS